MLQEWGECKTNTDSFSVKNPIDQIRDSGALEVSFQAIFSSSLLQNKIE